MGGTKSVEEVSFVGVSKPSTATKRRTLEDTCEKRPWRRPATAEDLRERRVIEVEAQRERPLMDVQLIQPAFQFADKALTGDAAPDRTVAIH